MSRAEALAPQTAERDLTRLFPDDHSEGDSVVADALEVFLDRLIKAGGATALQR